MPSLSNFEVALTASGESSGCIRMNPNPDLLQSVFKKTGLELLYRAKQGLLVMADFRVSRWDSNSGVQTSGGIGFR